MCEWTDLEIAKKNQRKNTNKIIDAIVTEFCGKQLQEMDTVSVPLRSGGKKMRKRRELDALVAHSIAKRACSSSKRQTAGNGINSQDQLLSQSTDEQEEYSWAKVRMSQRHPKNFPLLKTCAPLLFILSVFVMFSIMYWLYFDLREQLADHRNKIQQVSAISLNVPDALQKWHESSKALEQNQTAVNQRLNEIQQRIDNFEKDFIHLKESIHQKDEATASDKTVDLKDTVAGFGAKIESLRIDIESIREHYQDVQKSQHDDKLLLNKLQGAVDAAANSTASNANSDFNNKSLDLYRVMQEQCSTGIRNISGQLATINDTMSQKIKVLDDQVHDHTTKLDGLTESYANVSSHVTSMESEWPVFKQMNHQLEAANLRIETDVSTLKNDTSYLQAIVREIQSNQRMFKQSSHEDLAAATRSDPIFSLKDENPGPSNTSSQTSMIVVKNDVIPSSVTSGQLIKNPSAPSQVAAATNDSASPALLTNPSTIETAAASPPLKSN